MIIIVGSGWAIFPMICYWIGQKEERGTDGLLLGLLFGPVGIFITMMLKDQRIICPWCKRKLDKKKKRCVCGRKPGDTTPREIIDPIAAWEQKERRRLENEQVP